MYDIYFYKDKNGKSEVAEHIKALSDSRSKDSRIKLSKIREYIKILSEYGTRAGVPYVKHLDGDIWELRPLSDRILFAAWNGNGFVLLHMFVKKSQKTPAREILLAKRNLSEWRKRGDKK